MFLTQEKYHSLGRRAMINPIEAVFIPFSINCTFGISFNTGKIWMKNPSTRTEGK